MRQFIFTRLRNASCVETRIVEANSHQEVMNWISGRDLWQIDAGPQPHSCHKNWVEDGIYIQWGIFWNYSHECWETLYITEEAFKILLPL